MIQLTLMIGFASATYAFQGKETATGIFPEACELVRISDSHTGAVESVLFAWGQGYLLLLESVLIGDPHFEVLGARPRSHGGVCV